MEYIWADNPILVNTKIKHSYITELRERVNIELARRLLSAKTWIDDSLDNTIKDKKDHIIELRTELDNMCDIHVQPICNNDYVTYRGTENSSYLTNADSGLNNTNDTNLNSTQHLQDYTTEIGGCYSYNINVETVVCTGQESVRRISVWGGANEYDWSWHLKTDLVTNKTVEESSVYSSEEIALCPSQEALYRDAHDYDANSGL